MMCTTRNVVLVIATTLLALSATRAAAQVHRGTFALVGGRIETVTAGTIVGGTVLIRDGIIAAVGVDLAVPEGATVIDCRGLSIYPGMIDAGTSLGLVEIGSLPETRDQRELGEITPHVEALTAVNPNSVAIPVTRVNGVTSALTMPHGGLFPGTAALIGLVGYTPEQMSRGFRGVVMNFPTTRPRSPYQKPDAEQEKREREARERLDLAWSRAKLHARIDSAALATRTEVSPELVPEIAALARVVRGEIPLIIQVNAARDIDSALAWIEREHVRAILSGVSEGWRVAERIAAAGVPCLVGPVLTLPSRSSDRYDRPYANAGLLRRAGVRIALRTGEDVNVRNLPFHAGFAAAHGLGREEALRSVTIEPARIFGVDSLVGSIEPGKRADLFVSNGDPFEPATSILHLFIDGYRMPLESRHVDLYREFIERSPGVSPQ